MSYAEPLPDGWERVASRTRPGEVTYLNTITGRRSAQRPTVNAATDSVRRRAQAGEPPSAGPDVSALPALDPHGPGFDAMPAAPTDLAEVERRLRADRTAIVELQSTLSALQRVVEDVQGWGAAAESPKDAPTTESPVEAVSDEAEADAEMPLSADAWNQAVDESLYGALIMSLAYQSQRRERAGCGELIIMILGVLFTFAVLLMQSLTCWGLTNSIGQASFARDDDYSTRVFNPGGSDDPHKWFNVYYKDIAEMPIPTFAAMLFCYGMLADSILSEIRNLVVTYAILMANMEVAGTNGTGLVWWISGHVFHVLRVSMFLVFCCSLLFLIAFSDGPEDVLMNSLASVFILEADDTFMAIVSGTWLTRPRWVRDMCAFSHARCEQLAAAARSGGWHTAMELGVFSYFLGWCAFIPTAFVLQRRLGQGNLPLGPYQLSDRDFYTDTLYGRIVPAACLLSALAHVVIHSRVVGNVALETAPPYSARIKVDNAEPAPSRSNLFTFSLRLILFTLFETSMLLLVFFGLQLKGIQENLLSADIGIKAHFFSSWTQWIVVKFVVAEDVSSGMGSGGDDAAAFANASTAIAS